MKCKHCKGTGEANGEKCAECNGTGEVEAKEAKSIQSLDGRRDAVSCAVREKFGKTGGLEEVYVYAREVFDTYVVISKGDKLYRVDYAIDDAGAVSFTSEPVEVQIVYEPKAVQEAIARATSRGFNGCIVGPTRESSDQGARPTGNTWEVVVIQSGMSANRNFYGRQVLESALAKYEKARIYLDHVAEPARFGRSTKDLAGFLKDVRPVMLAQEAGGEPVFAIAATAVVTKKAIREELLEAWEAGEPSLYGLSHDVKASGKVYQHTDGEPAVRVDAIQKVESVDFVTNPAAGGRVMRLVASTDSHALVSLEEDGRMLKKLIESLRALGRADLIAKLGAEPTEDQVLEAIQEALKTAPARSDAPAAPATPAAASAAATVQEARISEGDAATIQEARVMIASLRVENDLKECALPDKLKDRIRSRFTKRIAEGLIPNQAEITAAIAEAVEDYGALAEAGVVMPHVGSIRMGEGQVEKTRQRIDDFFDPAKPARSFREMYLDITGDRGFTGKISEATRLRESIGSGTFDQALGDSITRRLLAFYQMPEFANWRAIATTGPVSDFRTQRRVRLGGYGNLPTVGQGGPYGALTSPTDEEATYAPAKRGGTEAITLEAIRNDDVNIIREIPKRLGRAAAQTLYEFVWDFLATNAAVYDATALSAAGHNNIVTTALSWSNFASLRLKLRNQTDMSNGKRLGLKARHLIVPVDLEELGYQLLNAERMLPDSSLASTAAPAAPNFARTQTVDLIVVDYWTDTNNYWLTASPDQAPMIEIGFMDGREDPELFVQDMPNVGSMFNNDQLTYKIRHIYGGAVMDFRPFAAGIVP
jgi:hypothetical protein